MNTRIDRTQFEPGVYGSTPVLGHPDDVVRDPRMTVDEKRAVLAAWASDAHAVENLPALRQLDDGSVVQVDDILHALASLDQAECLVHRAGWHPMPRRRGTILSRLRKIRPGRDHDDDPPPCPAAAATPVRLRRTEAVAAA
jgi:hypothetical protein